MTFAASLECLLRTLRACAPAKVDALAREKRDVAHGLLSVGLKLHCLDDAELFAPLITALGGPWRVLDHNVFKRSQAQFCLVLPPVGSAAAAIRLLDCLEGCTGCQMFNNPNIQLQVCSPGRLDRRNAALHAIGFYLSSDTLRQYSLEDFATTVSADYYQRGKRLVIYDAGSNGEFDAAFAWWGRTGQGLTIRPTLPFLNGRTDIMVGPGSKSDIHNINLLATLLVHAQSLHSDGYWSSLGELFVSDLLALLDRHLLTGLVEAPWITISEADGSAAHDQLFLSALQELTAYAVAEACRLKAMNEPAKRFSQDTSARSGILYEMQELLGTYRAIVTSIPEEAQGDYR